MKPGITVATPAVPTRAEHLTRAMASVGSQVLRPEAHVVVIDHAAEGEATTRNRALAAVDTEWTAFLDDDDELRPNHLSALLFHAHETQADLVYPWFDVVGGTDPLGWEGKAFDPVALRQANYIPVTYLVRTELAQDVGGCPQPLSDEWPMDRCVDWGFLLRLLDAGATFSHLSERTWVWNHWTGNLSGRTWR